MTDANPMDGDNHTTPEEGISIEDSARRIDAAMSRLAVLDLDGALAILTEVEETLRFPREPAARVQWARCLNGLGFIELMDAKQMRATRESGAQDGTEPDYEFQFGLKRAIARFEQALASQTVPKFRSYVEGNKAYVLALLGQTGAAETLLRRLFKDGGRDFYDGQVRDTERNPIPEDRAVRRLLDDLWEETDK
ncbi:MAG: hypothetical protein CMM61_03175 [Rhodospirillaceae bacterium]|nr:hypothetical protein [Rhodospirillaceae bacterium]|tara:strand:+ start:294 stop:875 length:582 start_codon:yes stop_codon:yes gene_type:complete